MAYTLTFVSPLLFIVASCYSSGTYPRLPEFCLCYAHTHLWNYRKREHVWPTMWLLFNFTRCPLPTKLPREDMFIQANEPEVLPRAVQAIVLESRVISTVPELQ